MNVSQKSGHSLAVPPESLPLGASKETKPKHLSIFSTK
jgi:hypothetical protein